MRFKKIMTWSPKEKKARLFRIYWSDSMRCFSVSLLPRLLQLKRIHKANWRLVVLGLSLHYMRSFCGRFA